MTASPGHSWGQKINVIVPKSVQLCVLPRAARDMEMGWMELQEQLCQPSGQPQRGCDWCDAGVTQGMWHTWGPPLPQAPLAPAWAAGGGLAIKMLLVFKQLESPCVCSLGGRLLTPPPRSARVGGGFPAPAVPGIAVCFGDSAPDQAALSADSAGTAPILSCRAPVPRLAPTAWGQITA